MKKFTHHLLKLFFFCFLLLSFLRNVSAQTTVVIPGDFQSELGCSGDWMPDCDATRLTLTGPGTWEGTFLIPAGAWQFKLAYDNAWNENYGEGGVPNGPNMSLVLGSPTSVHFTYSSVTHLVSLSFIAPAVTLAGDFQSELGCPGDWQQDCSASGLLYDAATNRWFGIFSIPPGNWEYKVTINNSWAENYGLDGVPNGPNIPLTVTGDKKILFRYDPLTHLVTATPINYSVILAGDFQSELGCPGDWQPDCPLTGLAFYPASNLWKGDFTLPAGNWQFKVTLDGSWAENYGEGGVLNGPNIELNLSAASKVSFVYNPETHLLTYTAESVTVVLPGSFQTELGCTGDWDPACDNTRLTFNEEKKIWTGTFTIPAGNWEYKVALNNSWAENYGEGGIPGGTNMLLNLEVPATITFQYDPQSHVVTLLFASTTLCATAFYDTNANGIKDLSEEIPMEGVAFTITGKDTQYTGSVGKTCFADLTPGLYTIQETVPAGYLPTTPTSQSLDLNQPQTLNFGMVCLGGAGTENIAFWMNKKGKAAFYSLASWQQDYILTYLRDFNLRNADGSDFDPVTFEALSEWLQRANAKNMAYKLSAQMAVLFLNKELNTLGSRMLHTPGIRFLGIDYNFMSVDLFIVYVNQQLFSNSFGGDANRAEHEALYYLTEQANEDLIFVQLQPCSSNLITAVKTQRLQEQDKAGRQAKVVLWPNPSANRFTLRLPNHAGDVQVQVNVVDVHGKQVYAATGSSRQEFRFGKNFLPGLYFVTVIQGSTRLSVKIVKQ